MRAQRSDAPTWLQREEKIDNYKPGGYRSTQIGEVLVDRYEILEKLGHGEFATVWVAKDKLDPKETCVAVKISSAEYSSIHPMTHELKHLQRLRDLRSSAHPGAQNVPNLRDNFLLQSRFGSHMCTVTDLLGYDLQCIALTQFHGRKQACTFPEEAAKAVARSLLTALDYCHSECGIIHTDVKIPNVMSKLGQDISASTLMESSIGMDRKTYTFDDADGQPVTIYGAYPLGFFPPPEASDQWGEMDYVLSDFGVAYRPDDTESIRPSIACPVSYRPPELAIGADLEDRADIWSTGCLIFELLTFSAICPLSTTSVMLPILLYRLFGNFPPEMVRLSTRGAGYFEDDGDLAEEIKQQIREKMGSDRISFDDYVTQVTNGRVKFSIECRDFLLAALTVDPTVRPSAKTLLGHPWLAKPQVSTIVEPQ